MAQLIADRRDVDFVLFEQMDIEKLAQSKQFNEFNKKTVTMTVTEARTFAIKEILPTNAEGDREGCVFEDGKVKVPASFIRIFRLLGEGGWIATIDDPAVGGQGMPTVVANACAEYFHGANCAFMIYPGIAHGAGKLIETFGTEKQKMLFLEKMYSGKWGGSMFLTEPQAGSDVGALTTSAVENPDGTYTITGNKIFITGAEQNLTENIVHPVLARIEGAPNGTKGISLFIVPKIWVNDDGSLGDLNDVRCDGIEEKLGIHGSATCSVTLGASGKCRGLLLGEKNKGMRAMFHMMNEARLLVGMQGLALASSSYLYAVEYAKQRLQGKHLLKMADPGAPQVPIINHPDIRRMLIWMKAHVSGMRSLNYYVGLCFDKVQTAENDADKSIWQGLIELLTPIVKAYCADKSFEVCTHAIQVYGGYGYTREYPVEQLLRDSKICSIYEGSNGIQAMDLLARKLGMANGKIFTNLLSEIKIITSQAKNINDLVPVAAEVETAVDRLAECALFLGQKAMSDKVLTAFAFAYPFLEIMGDIVLSWMLLWRAVVAFPKLQKCLANADEEKKGDIIRENSEAAFYDGQIRLARYFAFSVLPLSMGKMQNIKHFDESTVEMTEASF
ncbi:MAG: acyl-CoA dehydrogenase [Deltaproteobacteria bacterium]|nr:acyl-CoA dehydrogenase [Deltaproteobacteria bacterium]